MVRQNIMVDPSRRLLETYLDFSGGRNSEISNEELKDNEFPTLDNVDLWSRGSCKRRTGRKTMATIPNVTNTQGTQEVDVLSISAGASSSGNISITLNGTTYSVAVTAGDTANDVATKISNTSFSGWTVVAGRSQNGSTSTVTFTKIYVGACSAPSFSGGTTGVSSSSFTVQTAGTNASIVQGMFPFFISNQVQPDLIVAANGQLYYILAGSTAPTNIPITDSGNAWTFQTGLEVQGVMYKGIMYIATGTKLVQVTYSGANGWAAQTVTPYQPTVMEVTYIGTNALASNPNNWISDGTGTSLSVAGIYIGMTTGSNVGGMAVSGAVNTPFKMTCYINKPSSVTSVDYKWEYQLSTDGTTWTLGRDWTKDDGTGNAKNWTFTPQNIATYNIRVSVRDDANQSTTVATFIQSSWVVNATMDATEVNPPKTSGIQSCTNAIVFYDRLILSGDNQNPYQLYISDLTNPEYFPTDNTISFDTGKLEPITSVIQFRDFLIVFTASTIQTLTGHTPATYARALIQDGIGCIATRSAIVTGNTVTFLSSQGIMQLKPNPFLLQILNVNRVDMQIRTEVLNAIANGGQNACAFLYNSQYWICFPSSTQMFRLYFETGNIWTRDYSSKVVSTQFVVYGSNRWELGTDGNVYVQDDTRYDDDGVVYTMIAEGKFFDLGSSFNWKLLKRIYFIAKGEGTNTNLNVYVTADSRLTMTPDSGYTTISGDTTVWNIGTTPNFPFSAGSTTGAWILGKIPLGHTEISVMKSSLRGKCRRVKVKFTHAEANACEVFGFGVEFREKQPQTG